MKQLAALGVAFAITGTIAAPAHAHHLSDFRRQRTHIETRARGQVGSPYHYGGTSPGGFDCSGFTRWVYLQHGASLPHSSQQQFDMANRKGYERIWKRTSLEIGDLVFHKTTGAQVGHAGVYIGHGRFISSTTSAGVRVRSLWDPSYWGPRWVGATRPPVTMRYQHQPYQ